MYGLVQFEASRRLSALDVLNHYGSIDIARQPPFLLFFLFFVGPKGLSLSLQIPVDFGRKRIHARFSAAAFPRSATKDDDDDAQLIKTLVIWGFVPGVIIIGQIIPR